MADLNAVLLSAVGGVSKASHALAMEDRARRVRTPVVKFDPERIDRYWTLINPSNQSSLAAVFTRKMADTDIRQLRTSFLETFRQQSVEGWTANETNKRLQSAWDAIAGNMDGNRFVDAAGREWENARYLQMLTNTTLARVQRESYVDTLIGYGDKLARIQSYGENCPVCDAWDGVIVDMTGQSPDHPSYQEALAAGWAHPNCTCTLEGLVESVDGKEIERQAAAENVDWTDPAQVHAYNDAIRIREKVSGGMTREAAAVSLKRDKIRREIERAWLGDVDSSGLPRNENMLRALDRIPDSTVAKLITIPRFAYSKKGEPPAFYMPRGRGTIYLDREDGSHGGRERVLHHEFGHHFARDQGIVGPGDKAAPPFQNAIDDELKRFLDEGAFGVEPAKLRGLEIEETARQIYESHGREFSDSSLDLIGGLSGGQYGRGHSVKAYQAHGYDEVFANAFEMRANDGEKLRVALPFIESYIKRVL